MGIPPRPGRPGLGQPFPQDRAETILTGADLAGFISGTMRILRRRVLLPAGTGRWASGVARPANQPAMPGLPHQGVMVLEVERDPADNPRQQIGWWFIEVLCAPPGAEAGSPEFFPAPKPRDGAPMPEGTATVARITLAERQFAHWLMQLRAPPFPALVLDAAERTAMLELRFDPPL